MLWKLIWNQNQNGHFANDFKSNHFPNELKSSKSFLFSNQITIKFDALFIADNHHNQMLHLSQSHHNTVTHWWWFAFNILKILSFSPVQWKVAMRPEQLGSQSFDCFRWWNWKWWTICCCYNFTFSAVGRFQLRFAQKCHFQLGSVFWQCRAKVWLSNSLHALTIIFEPTSNDGGKLRGPSEPREGLAMKGDRPPSILCYPSAAGCILAPVAYLLAYFPCIVTACVQFKDWSPAADGGW